jgi:hypothetical protein
MRSGFMRVANASGVIVSRSAAKFATSRGVDAARRAVSDIFLADVIAGGEQRSGGQRRILGVRPREHEVDGLAGLPHIELLAAGKIGDLVRHARLLMKQRPEPRSLLRRLRAQEIVDLFGMRKQKPELLARYGREKAGMTLID